MKLEQWDAYWMGAILGAIQMFIIMYMWMVLQ